MTRRSVFLVPWLAATLSLQRSYSLSLASEGFMRRHATCGLVKGALIAVFVVAVGVMAPRSAEAQDPAPVDSLAMMQEMMGPMMSNMMASMMQGMLAVLAQPETAEKLATFTRNYFDALRRKGFTDEQALRLVAAIGFPSLGGGQ